MAYFGLLVHFTRREGMLGRHTDYVHTNHFLSLPVRSPRQPPKNAVYKAHSIFFLPLKTNRGDHHPREEEEEVCWSERTKKKGGGDCLQMLPPKDPPPAP